MNITTPVLALVCAVGGVVGAVTAVVLVDDAPSTPDAAALVPAGENGELRALRTRLEFVESQNQRFAERIQELEIAAAEFGEIDLTPRELAPTSASAPVARAEVAPEQLVDSVGEALETILAQQEAERDRERAERRAERTEDRLTELAEQLGLDAYQVTQMRDWMTESEAARDALRDELRESGNWRESRDAFETLRDESRKGLEAFLMPHQLETYDELNSERFARFRGWGGGGGGGGPGGGGGF